MNVQTQCKVCGKPMTVECVDPGSELTPVFEKLLQMATCDDCMARRYPKDKRHQPEQAPLPYNDQ